MRARRKPVKILSALALICFLVSPVIQAQEGNAELLKKLDFLQQQIDELKLQLEQTQNKAVETDAKVEAAIARQLLRVAAPLLHTASNFSEACYCTLTSI